MKTKFLEVKTHDLKSKSHLPVELTQEPNYKKSVAQNLIDAFERYKHLPFMAYRAGMSTNTKQIVENYSKFTYGQATSYIKQITGKMNQLEFSSGDRAVIYAKNSPFWLLSDVSIQFLQGISAPIYDTLGLDNIKYCINKIGAKYIFVSSEYLPNILGSLEELKTLKHIICFDGYDIEKTKQETHKVIAQFANLGVLIDDSASLYSLTKSTKEDLQIDIADQPSESQINFQKVDQLIESGSVGDIKVTSLTVRNDLPEEIDYLKILASQSTDPKADSTIIFTSGTSNHPKAVILNHENVFAGLGCLGRQFVPYHLNDKGQQSSTLSYLPLAHVFQHCLEFGAMLRGHLIYYSSGSIKNLTFDLLLSKPSYLLGVPRVYNKIYQSVMGKMAKASVIKKAIFNAAFWCKKTYLKTMKGGIRNPHMPLIDLIFKPISQAMGGNVEFIVSGSSALTAETRQFLEVCSGARVTTGYGLSECSSAGAYNYCGQKMNHQNQLGFMSHDTFGRVKDCSDLCEFSVEKDQIGELQVKGICVAQGYVGEQWGDVVKIVDKDGWYSTGDLVKLNQDGSVSFIRRISQVVKLQHGEFVDLEQIEGALEADPLILTAFVHAEADKSAPVALVSVDSAVLKAKIGEDALQKFKDGDLKQVKDLLTKVGDQAVRIKGLKGFNVPKAYEVFLDVDWTTNTEFYTSTSKKKHQYFVNAHQKQIEKLWGEVTHGEQVANGIEVQKGSQKGKYFVGLGIAIAVVGYFLMK